MSTRAPGYPRNGQKYMRKRKFKRKARKSFTHSFRNKKYTICFHHKYYGECDSPDNVNRKIRLGTKFFDEEDELETYIHEALHACFWDLEEDAVDESAKNITKFLLKVGTKVHAPKKE